jgi:hypothetical protein
MNPLEGIDINVLLDAIEQIELPDQESTPPNITRYNEGALNAETVRRLRMLQVVSKFASTLTLRPIKVALSSGSEPNHQTAPAWSDSDNIWFNDTSMGDLSDVNTVLNVKIGRAHV